MDVLVYIFEGYLVIGLLFAIAFSVRGASAIDEDVLNAPKGFRILLIPGAMLLWPLLLFKWLKQ